MALTERAASDAPNVEKRANAEPTDWSWPFLHTGTVADGLIRAACVRNDGRERTLAAAVEITDDRAITDSKRLRTKNYSIAQQKSPPSCGTRFESNRATSSAC